MSGAGLVRRARAGDRAAMNELVETFQEPLLRFCVYLAGNPQLAQDLCQDTLVQVLTRLKQLKEPERFQSWLFKIAKNLFLDHLRQASHRDYEPIESVTEAPLAGDPQACQKVLEIQQALAGIPAEDRALLLLVDLEGYSYAEAARTLDLNESAIPSRLHRIRELFMRKYR